MGAAATSPRPRRGRGTINYVLFPESEDDRAGTHQGALIDRGLEGLSPGGCKYPGLPELPEEPGSMPSLFRRMPAGMVRAGLMQLVKRLMSRIFIADELRLRTFCGNTTRGFTPPRPLHSASRGVHASRTPPWGCRANGGRNGSRGAITPARSDGREPQEEAAPRREMHPKGWLVFVTFSDFFARAPGCMASCRAHTRSHRERIRALTSRPFPSPPRERRL